MELNNLLENMDSLELVGMRFEACHGCLPEEKTTPQPFVVDATMFLPMNKAAATDDVSDTVDYVSVFALVENIVTSQSFNLIETLAQNIAEAILNKFPAVKRVRITVHKAESPLVKHLADVKTTLERSQKCEIVS